MFAVGFFIRKKEPGQMGLPLRARTWEDKMNGSKLGSRSKANNARFRGGGMQ